MIQKALVLIRPDGETVQWDCVGVSELEIAQSLCGPNIYSGGKKQLKSLKDKGYTFERIVVIPEGCEVCKVERILEKAWGANREYSETWIPIRGKSNGLA